MKFSFKKITNKYFYKNQDTINQKIEIFKKKIRRIPLKDIVSIDETGFWNNDNVNYIWGDDSQSELLIVKLATQVLQSRRVVR